MIYQIVFSIFTCHEIFNIYHGNIKTSNFLVNRFMYMYLADFASYKPVYLLQNTEHGLSEFRLFYPLSEDKCYFAPEKLIDQDFNLETASSKNLFNFNARDS